MKESFVMVNHIKDLVKKAGLNPHKISRETGITYRMVRRLCNDDTISPSTHIVTLDQIAKYLDVKVDDLYTTQESGNQ